MSSRRQFLKASAGSLFTLSISTALSGCANVISQQLSAGQFKHGVACGDPQKDAVIIWTRISTANKTATVAWELATDNQFNNIVRKDHFTTDASRDFTVKIDVQDLTANTEYFYRFSTLNETSPIGRAKTLAVDSVEQLKMVVVSCSNFPAGYFNAYTDAAKQSNLDAVLHLGDYIYEYPMGGYATENAQRIGRQLAADNEGEILSLSDYRKRYALYRTDSGLQALHAAAPFIVVWDDHEISNDTFKSGAENHSQDEGDFFKRRAAAIQAYYEWLPIRPTRGEQNPHIYRSFDFGDLASLHMLDTRVIARDKQLSYSNYLNPQTKQMDISGFFNDLNQPNRKLLGQEQFNWLTQSIAQSNAKWQVLGQQVLMAKMWLPSEIFAQQDRAQVPKVIAELVAIKRDILQNKQVSAQHVARVNSLLPYNLDAWDGYPLEREALLQQINKLNKPLVVVAGDTHNAWYANLNDAKGQQVGVEFATPGVTSPGMEHYLKLNDQQAEQMAQALALLINDLNYCNLSQRGYMVLTLNQQQAIADWYFIDNIDSPQYKVTNREQHIYSA